MKRNIIKVKLVEPIVIGLGISSLAFLGPQNPMASPWPSFGCDRLGEVVSDLCFFGMSTRKPEEHQPATKP